jgi:glutamate synthase domain-containing protein 3
MFITTTQTATLATTLNGRTFVKELAANRFAKNVKELISKVDSTRFRMYSKY